MVAEERPLPASRYYTLPLAGLLLFLQACASEPVADQSVAPGSEPVPELTLNLPEQAENCVCAGSEAVDHTFLEKGFDALAAGDHIEAVQYFQRYQRLEKSPRADWEAGIAIAYDSMLPRSPFYDPEAAAKSYAGLSAHDFKGEPVHTKILMMRDALETFVAMDRKITKLNSENKALSEDLAKREEALKRLRELTLGQKVE
jgi:hypothetical protein